ncbi:hypothetical protein OVY01_23035, partial [Robbsia sp. Bb-Pol-6]
GSVHSHVHCNAIAIGKLLAIVESKPLPLFGWQLVRQSKRELTRKHGVRTFVMLFKPIPKGGAVLRAATGQGKMGSIYPAFPGVIVDFTRTHIHNAFGSTTGAPAYLLHRHVELRHGFAF